MSTRRAGSGPETVRDLLVATAGRLGSATEARWLVEEAVGPSRGGAISLALAGTTVSSEESDVLEGLLQRRLAGEPLQYILGRWAFRSLELAVDPRVLIPRPETEVVVGYALDELASLCASGDGPLAGGGPVVAVDLGTGSGAIALSLAVEGPRRCGSARLEVLGTDASADALAVARANAAGIEGGDAVQWLQGEWFEALPAGLEGGVALVVANPPYVSEAEWEGLDAEVRDHEPKAAIVAGPGGDEAVRRITEEAPRWLAPWGVLVMEIAPDQSDDASLGALVSGFDAVVVRPDFAGRSRALIARRWG